jgi:hypothetical protein
MFVNLKISIWQVIMLLITAKESVWKFVEIWVAVVASVAQKVKGFCEEKWNVV